MKAATQLWLLFLVALLLPLSDLILPREYRVAELMRPIFIFAILGMGLNVVTGFTGLLNLGVAAFMAVGAYTFAILTCDIYPFQLGFWPALGLTTVIGLIPGLLLGLPTLRLRGDYLAIVTVGFGEIVQDCLKNLETITKGTQGINPLPSPSLFGYVFTSSSYFAWYYFLLVVLAVVTVLTWNLQHSRVGRRWESIREDQLAATCMGIDATRVKLLAFALSAAYCSLAGALWASYLGSSGEPGNYDFQVSVIALCILILGGLGSIFGVLIGAVVMMGFNTIVLVRLTTLLTSTGLVSGTTVWLSPSNYKYAVFGLALILMMRYRPNGLFPTGLRSYGGGRMPVDEDAV